MSLPFQSLEEVTADLERTSWRRADTLTGEVVHFSDELKQKLPEDDCFGPVYESNNSIMENVKVFSRNRKGSTTGMYQNVAYECRGSCNGIVLGPPKIEPFNTIHALAGKQGVRYSCVKCNSTLYEEVIGWS